MPPPQSIRPFSGLTVVLANMLNIPTYSFIANCQTADVHKNKTKRRSKIYKSQYILRYNILTVKLQSVIREMLSGEVSLL